MLLGCNSPRKLDACKAKQSHVANTKVQSYTALASQQRQPDLDLLSMSRSLLLGSSCCRIAGSGTDCHAHCCSLSYNKKHLESVDYNGHITCKCSSLQSGSNDSKQPGIVHTRPIVSADVHKRLLEQVGRLDYAQHHADILCQQQLEYIQSLCLQHLVTCKSPCITLVYNK